MDEQKTEPKEEKKIIENPNEGKKIETKFNEFSVKVDEEEVKRVVAMLRETFKRTPPRLNYEHGEYSWFNKILSETSFEHCFDGMDSLRTLYEAMYPMFHQLFTDKEAAVEETQKFSKPMSDLFTILKVNKYHKEGENPFSTVQRFINDLDKGVLRVEGF